MGIPDCLKLDKWEDTFLYLAHISEIKKKGLYIPTGVITCIKRYYKKFGPSCFHNVIDSLYS